MVIFTVTLHVRITLCSVDAILDAQSRLTRIRSLPGARLLRTVYCPVRGFLLDLLAFTKSVKAVRPGCGVGGLKPRLSVLRMATGPF